MDQEQCCEQRLDKWLKIALLFKTRSQATAACEERKVKVNGAVAKPARNVKSGDILTIRRPNGKYVDVKILAVSERNLSREQARLLYHIDEPEIAEETRELMVLFDQAMKAARPKYKGRPTKKLRRDMDNFTSVRK
jgi:ribosome-associated heat shock protein Hsp15